mmetsp:Transcript_20120/g.41710  ORF Transcript_20120/g.41710 Transcript_20120/m.41710 type:complete len:608 (+) Transcript_20120:85-1908(+)
MRFPVPFVGIAISRWSIAPAYKAAVVELPSQFGESGAQRLRENAEVSVNYARDAALAGAQIIVLPEYGLTGFAASSRDAYLPLLEQIPDPHGDVPCDNPVGYAGAPTVVTLSCGAKANGIAIVASMGDVVYCGARQSPACASSVDGRLQFNTAVAFDTDGAFLAKYHKQNLWGEDAYFDVPQECRKANFTTSFGVTFGLFICADLIHYFPAQQMVDDGLTNFVAPVAWSDEMAQMQVMPLHQGWSLRNCANILVSNHPWIGGSTKSSGSGIFSCGDVKAYYYTPSNSPGPILYAELASNPVSGRRASSALHQRHPGLALLPPPGPSASALPDSGRRASQACIDVPGFVDEWVGQSLYPTWGGTCAEWAPHDCSKAVEEWGYSQQGEDDILANCPASCGSCGQGAAPSHGWQFAPLSSGRVCSGNLCCAASALNGSAAGYVLAALKGVDSGCGFGGNCASPSLNWQAEACAVLSCPSPGGPCLNYQTPSGALFGISLSMDVSTGTSVYPHVLAYGGGSVAGAQELITPDAGLNFTHNGGSAVLNVSSPNPLTSAILYGRPYGLGEDVLRYNCLLTATSQRSTERSGAAVSALSVALRRVLPLLLFIVS